MKILTKAYGTMEVRRENLLTFPQGLLGFERLRSFALIEAHEPPFLWLQSLEELSVAFVLVDPFMIRSDYEIDLSDDELASVDTKKAKETMFLAIVTFPQDGERPITVNLQGPLLINKINKEGAQIISSDSRWRVRHSLLDELKANKRRRQAK